MRDIIPIANRICHKLEGYSTAVVGEPDFEDISPALTHQEELALLREIDRRIFCCAECGYWQRQIENATPDAQNWVCKECHRDDDSE